MPVHKFTFSASASVTPGLRVRKSRASSKSTCSTCPFAAQKTGLAVRAAAREWSAALVRERAKQKKKKKKK